MRSGSIKVWLIRLAKSVVVLGAIWVVSYLFFGLNAAFGFVSIAIIWSIVGALIT